jgi:hypothetical protein
LIVSFYSTAYSKKRNNYTHANKIVFQIQAISKNNGNLKALVENKKLNLSAEKKLQDMFDKQYF